MTNSPERPGEEQLRRDRAIHESHRMGTPKGPFGAVCSLCGMNNMRPGRLAEPCVPIEAVPPDMTELAKPVQDSAGVDKVEAIAEVPREKRRKASYVGAPAIFKLELYCQQLNDAFDAQCYLVGSALERPDWRDIDVRMIMDDEQFAALFPNGSANCRWEFDPRWIIMTTSISEQMSKTTGLPVDFQFQPRTHANERHGNPQKGGYGTRRSALGMYFRERTSDE